MEDAIAAKRLKHIRELRGFTQKQVAEILGMTVSGYAFYEQTKKKREPNLSTLAKLANIFDVSADYLIGLTDEIR